MEPEEELKQRKSKANEVWSGVKNQMKKIQEERDVKACIAGALLFHCNTITWWKNDTKVLQSWLD